MAEPKKHYAQKMAEWIVVLKCARMGMQNNLGELAEQCEDDLDHAIDVLYDFVSCGGEIPSARAYEFSRMSVKEQINTLRIMHEEGRL